MAKYLVCGPHDVAGVAPGGVVELSEDVNVDALLAAGHVTPAKRKSNQPQLPAPIGEED